jgi:hypothetical protein
MDNPIVSRTTVGRARRWSSAKRPLLAGLTALACAVPTAAVLASDGQAPTPALVEQVRETTRSFRNVENAVAAGYASEGACVSGPEEGAMGIHYADADLVVDAELRADQPELLIYEQRGDRLRLVGVEYLVFVDAWNAAGNTSPPVFVGQHFNLVNSPNRYAIPPFYELHVWAWRDNPFGVFVDWNPTVSCADYSGESGQHDGGH